MSEDSSNGPVGIVAKFLCAALFGAFLSFLLFAGAVWWDLDFLWRPPWIHAFWGLPVVWGVLGIFCFESMLDLARRLVEAVLGTDT